MRINLGKTDMLHNSEILQGCTNQTSCKSSIQFKGEGNSDDKLMSVQGMII